VTLSEYCKTKIIFGKSESRGCQVVKTFGDVFRHFAAEPEFDRWGKEKKQTSYKILHFLSSTSTANQLYSNSY